MNTVENNRLIAEFMGFNPIEFENRSAGSLRYDKSFDWLMPVVEKIGKLKTRESNEFQIKLLHFLRNEVTIFDLCIFDSKGEVFQRCVDFINWYNKNK